MSSNSIMVWLTIIEDWRTYVNWTTCVPNLANKRIIVNYTIGPNTDMRVWNGP